MANKIEFSRLVFKRSTQTGVEPTIPTATTIDNTWLDTDLLIGEGFINVEDDKFWFRTNNGIVEMQMSGISSDNWYTQQATLSGNTIVFDRNDTLNAYSVDLSGIAGVFTGGTVTGDTQFTGGLTGNTLHLLDTTGGAATTYLGLDSNNQIVAAATPTVTVTGDTVIEELSATTISILNSGATARDYFDYSSNTVESGVTNSAIVAGSGNTISGGLSNVFISGVDITASSNDTSYFSNVNVASTLTVNGSTVQNPTGGNYIDVTGSSVVSLTGVPMDMSFAVSDETTALTTGTTKLTIFAPYDFELEEVRASLSVTGSSLTTVDVNLNDSTIFSTPITIDGGEYTTETAENPSVLKTFSADAYDKITVDIDGAGTGAAGLKIYILGTRTL